MEEVNPSDVVDGDAVAGDQAGGEVDSGAEESGRSIREYLFATEPNPPLESNAVESLIDLENGGLPRVARGLKKIARVEGQPAVLDVALGLLEEFVSRSDLEFELDGDGDGGEMEIVE